MTISKILNGEKVKILQVDIIQKINSEKFIVADETEIAIMKVTPESKHQKHVIVGKSVKIVKPFQVEENVISWDQKFTPMSSKSMNIKIDEEKLKNIKLYAKKLKDEISKGTSFKEIEEDYQQNSVIDTVLAYVTSVSRTIDGTYGPYKICNLRDCEGSSNAINLYQYNVNKLKKHKAYKIENVKKTGIVSENGNRLATTKFTKIKEATEIEAELFINTPIADKCITGTCIMISNLLTYNACPYHSNKISDEGQCPGCTPSENKKLKPNNDFKCNLVIESDNDSSIVQIATFKRHLNIDTWSEDVEENIIEKLEEKIVGKICKIDYNVRGSDDNFAERVVIV